MVTAPFDPIPEPMLAKLVAEVPDTAGLSFEPKWDGFRAIVAVSPAGEVEIGSRGSKPLTRYFPELVAEFAGQLPKGTVVDGEIIVRTGVPGGERLDWELLSQRIHPAESRVEKLSVETPASFVGFDLLAEGGQSLLDARVLGAPRGPRAACSRRSRRPCTCRRRPRMPRPPAAGSSSSRAPASTASSPSRSPRPYQRRASARC